MEERPYLAIVEDKAERSHNRLERTEASCRISHPTEQFGRGRRGGLGVRLVLIHSGAWLGGLVGMNNFWSTIGKGSGVYIVRRND